MNKWLLTMVAGVVIAVALGVAFSLSDRMGMNGVTGNEGSTSAEPPQAAAPPSAEPPQAAAPPPDALHGPDQAHEQPAIHETAYTYLAQFGEEKDGYGLYSYVLFPHPSLRAKAFLENLFATTGAAAESRIAPENINILYLPTDELQTDAPTARSAGGPEALATLVIDDLYDYALARALMAKICTAPADPVADLCAGDLSRGPYLFTYARPVSNLSPVPPPYLFVDLSPVHERAFSEFIAAYKAQVKRSDYTDRERIETFRLRLLSIVLTATDWIGPARAAVADIVHIAEQ
jgi:hypothetical protein